VKVTFIYPDFFQYPDGTFMPEGRIYLGVAYLSAVLKERGHEVSLIHVVRPPEREWLISKVKEESPDLIGLSSTTHMFRHAAKWASWLSDELDIPIACGGVHATISPEEVISTKGISIACIGEAEETITELCDAMEAGKDYSKIKGIWIKRDGEVIKNETRPLVENLDSIPFPDRSIFDPSNFCPEQHPRGTLMASRGCPFNCSYCSNHAQRSVYPNPEKYVRFRSPENVVEEIVQMISENPSIEYIRFDDDILTVDIDWLSALSEFYRKRVSMPFICNSRVNFINEKTIGILSEMGCIVVCMGIESGNDWMRRKVLGRQMSNEMIERAFKLCHEAGIKTVSTNMFGLPFENRKMVLDTIKLNARCHPDTIQVSTFIPYPKTNLEMIARKADLIENEQVDSIFEGRSPVRQIDSGWEAQTIKRNFHTLAFLYGQLDELPLNALSRISWKAIDSLFLSEIIPATIRKKAVEKILSWAKDRFHPEWIKY